MWLSYCNINIVRVGSFTVAKRCMVLNASYEYLGILPWTRAITLVLENKAHIVQPYEGEYIHSVSQTFDLPAVIILNEYKKLKKRKRSFAASTRNVLIRDNFICQYCGCKLTINTGTKDHVVPFSRGGPTTMKNLVAACRSCNTRKDDRSCEEAKMYPINSPRELSEDEKLRTILKTFSSKERKVWLSFLKDKGIKLW